MTLSLNTQRKRGIVSALPMSHDTRPAQAKGVDHEGLAKLSKHLRDERQQMEQQVQIAAREEAVADLEKAIGKAFTLKRTVGASKTVYLVEVGKRKVKVKQALDRKDSASLSIEEFVERYAQEA